MLTANFTQPVKGAAVAVEKHGSVTQNARTKTCALRSADDRSIREAPCGEIDGRTGFVPQLPALAVRINSPLALYSMIPSKLPGVTVSAGSMLFPSLRRKPTSRVPVGVRE